MSTSVACKTVHVATPVGQFVSDPVSIIISQNGCDQGLVVSSELNLTEMTEVEYTHLQHIIQSQMEAEVAEQDKSVEVNLFNKGKIIQPSYTVYDPSNHPENKKYSTACSPQSTPAVGHTSAPSTLSTEEQYSFLGSSYQGQEVQEIKVVLCSDPHANITEAEKTPTSCVEVPDSVLEKAKYINVHSIEPSNHRTLPPLQLRPNPSARVCLEKRFNCSPSDKTRQQESQAAVLNTFLSVLHHSTDMQSIALLSQSENWPKAEKISTVECTHSYGGSLMNSHVQGLNHLSQILEGSKHPEVILPKNFSCREDKTTNYLLKAPYITHTEEAEENVCINLENETEGKSSPPDKRFQMHRPRALQTQTPNIIYGPGTCKTSCVVPSCKRGRRTGPPLEVTQRRERHNRKERERRRRIRLCCDELNLLVPFCSAETDKATTLQWTSAFLKYITEVYGESLKQDFENTFCGKTGVRLKPSSASFKSKDTLSSMETFPL